MVKADMVKPGAAVVAAGVSFADGKLVSDVDDDVAEVAGWLSPRIGGWGDDPYHAYGQHRGRRRAGCGLKNHDQQQQPEATDMADAYIIDAVRSPWAASAED